MQNNERLHILANLGGLVAIAQLDAIEPDLLLGALLEINDRIHTLPITKIELLRKRGLHVLRARGSERRAFSYHPTTKNMMEDKVVALTLHQVKQLLLELNGKLPALKKDFIPELFRTLGGLYE